MTPPINPPVRQPIRWGRVAAWTGGALTLLAFVGYFLSTFLLNRYLRSEAFRTLVSEKTAAFFRVEGEYQPIHNNGFSFYSDGYDARGEAGSPLKGLRADQIRADFEPAALFEGAWQVSNVQIQRVKITLSNLSPQPTAPAFGFGAPSSAAASSGRQFSWIPNRFELKRARIEEADFQWSAPVGTGSLRQMRLLLEPSGHDLLVTGYGGRLQQAGCPEFTVDHLKLRCSPQRLFLTDSLLHLGEAESFEVSGQADRGAARALDLLVKFNGVSITPFLPVDWRARVKGNASGDAHITGSFADAASMEARGTLALAGAQLEALPLLDRIANFTSTRQFRQFALQKAEAAFVWTKAKLTVSKLIAESEGLIRLEGGCTVERGTLQGAFQLGVTPSSLRWLPGSRERVFTQDRDGYVWTTLQISGPLDRLHEDLSERLVAAAGQEIIDGVKGSVETGTKVIESGAKTLFDLLKTSTP